MRIALTNDRFYPSFGGVENSLYYLALDLLHRGHTATIVVGQHDEDLPREGKVGEVDVFRYNYPISAWTYFLEPLIHVRAAARQFQRLLDQIDAVWCRSAYTCCAAGRSGFDGPVVFIPPVLLKPFDQRIQVHLKGKLLHRLALRLLHHVRSPQRAYIERSAFQNSSWVVTFSDNVAAQVCDCYPFVENRISVVRPGVDVSKFIPQNPNLDLMRRYRLSKEHTIFLYVGRLTAEKNVDRLIKAFSMMEGSNDRLLIVGDGYHKPFLEQLSRELGVEKKVSFAGYQKETQVFYALADFFVLPTLYEGFGQVYLEALASGVPCIGYAGEFTATAEILDDGVNGFVVYEHSSEALGTALQYASDLGKERYEQMRQVARKTALENYRWEHFVSEVLELTQECLHGDR
jgi:glycosyltransferase involved in cell wall biosynthesis